LHDALIWIEAIQLDMASFWIGEIKKDLPKLLRALDKLERKRRPRKQKRNRANAPPGGKRKGVQPATAALKPAKRKQLVSGH
jgi:hypothetical protein